MKIRLTYTVPAKDHKLIAEWYKDGHYDLISGFAEENLDVNSVNVSALELRNSK